MLSYNQLHSKLILEISAFSSWPRFCLIINLILPYKKKCSCPTPRISFHHRNNGNMISNYYWVNWCN